jgi:hypothetical protein
MLTDTLPAIQARSLFDIIYIVAHVLRLIVTFARKTQQRTQGARRHLRAALARPFDLGVSAAA